jgi:hypothetical protein
MGILNGGEFVGEPKRRTPWGVRRESISMRQGNKSVLSVPNGGRRSPLTHDRSSSTLNTDKISVANFNNCSILHTLAGADTRIAARPPSPADSARLWVVPKAP